MNRRRFLRTTLLSGALLGSAAVVGRHLSGYHLDSSVAAQLGVLSPKEFLVLRAVAARMLAVDADDAPAPDPVAVGLFVDRYLARLDTALRADVRALLHLLEHGTVLFRLAVSRFTHMSADEQDRTLSDWETSRLAVRRRGFQALKTLCFLGYYRDDRTWPLIGYPGPMLPARVPG